MVNAFNILKHLISFPSISRSGNRLLIDWVFDLLKEHGIDATLYPNPSGDRASLFASIGGAVPAGLFFPGIRMLFRSMARTGPLIRLSCAKTTDCYSGAARPT